MDCYNTTNTLRWLFVINSIITVTWGFFGFFMIPDLPNKPNPLAFWFDRNHGEMAMARLKRHHRAEPKKVTWAAARYVGGPSGPA